MLAVTNMFLNVQSWFCRILLLFFSQSLQVTLLLLLQLAGNGPHLQPCSSRNHVTSDQIEEQNPLNTTVNMTGLNQHLFFLSLWNTKDWHHSSRINKYLCGQYVGDQGSWPLFAILWKLCTVTLSHAKAFVAQLKSGCQFFRNQSPANGRLRDTVPNRKFVHVGHRRSCYHFQSISKERNSH